MFKYFSFISPDSSRGIETVPSMVINIAKWTGKDPSTLRNPFDGLIIIFIIIMIKQQFLIQYD